MAKPIKVSDEVLRVLSRLRGHSESYDACLRRHFGLASRKGEPQSLLKYYIVDAGEGEAPIARRTLAEARGEAILLSVKRGGKRTDNYKKVPVLTVREVPS